ncbi:hypothetical protein PV325_008213 [Microctonus aethiopoides]|nr:hypothetical protein PV325_008213 [Microctonus aethiopoides]
MQFIKIDLSIIIFIIFLNINKSQSETENVSNILRLSKPKKLSPSIDTSSTTIINKFNHSDEKLDFELSINNSSEQQKQPPRFITFSKNNPELDWKNHLKSVGRNDDSLRDLDVNFMKEKIEITANSVQWLVDLYDPLRWITVPGKLTNNCKTDMELFLKALKDGKLWAAKMSDASGRYSSQFHFGNGFWLGSSTLCKELNDTNENVVNRGIIGVDLPIYSVKFYVARLGLMFPVDVEPSTRQIFLGLCLPGTCDRLSITSMLRASADRVEIEGNSTHHSTGPRITIVAVKPVPSNDYSLWKDPKLYILGTVSGIIILLMIIATMYNYKELETDDNIESTSSGINNNERGIYIDKNCVLGNQRRLSMIQDNSKELIEKIEKGSVQHITNDELSDKQISNQGLGIRCLLAFSPIVNGSKIISTDPAARDSLTCLHGLRVLSLGWVVMRTFSNDIILSFNEFVRLTPAYLFVLGMNELAIKDAQARTVFSPVIIDHVTCEKFWWRNALYINSLYPRSEMCMMWSWYMANDTQFYVLGILLLLISVKYFKAVAITVLIIIVSSWFTTFSIAYSNEYIARIQEPFALFDELYDKPWLRAGPYFIGTITGWWLFKTNCKMHTPKWFQIIGWIISSLIMLLVVYGLYPGNLTIAISSIYASLGHTAWAIAVSFIVIQCCTGSAKIINNLLSLRLLYPLSRLTYCAYLVHPVIMLITSTQMDGPLHLYNGIVLIVYFGNLVASYLLSFCISIALEAPVVNLLKIAFASSKPTR